MFKSGSPIDRLITSLYDFDFKNFGINLKFGAYENFGAKKDQLKDLLIYQTVNGDSYITLKTYVEKMLEEAGSVVKAPEKPADVIR